jgi:hydroxyacylglutathione hydrolase
MDIVRKSFPVGPLQCNCTVLGDTETGTGYVFDPGGDPERVMAAVTELGLQIIGIVHTHAHLDHILAAGHIHEQTGAPIWLHRDDRFLWDTAEQQCALWGVPYSPLPEPHHWLEHEQDLACGGSCIHTPGHTPGSVSFYFADARLLLAGDTLFLGSVGRTDLPGGDTAALQRSIRERLYTLDEAARVVTGHGPETVLGREMRHNAFVRAC